VVDRHKFVNLIRNDKDAGEMYINMNKLCIKHIQEEIQRRLEKSNSEWESFRLLFGRLYKDIEVPLILDDKVDCDKLVNMNINRTLCRVSIRV
jgi:hypothetical protein